MQAMNLSSSSPSAARRLISQGITTQPTYVRCKGFLQANIVIIPSTFADAFEKFCSMNTSACPLLYRSKQGEVAAPPLADDSDIRTKLAKYWHHKDGKLHEELLNLKSFEWKDMVSFYLGCSFGFEEAIQRAGINLVKGKENEDVSMYTTNIKCIPYPPFSANMVVSMRSIPRKQLQVAFEATCQLDCAHGAPVHIGDPAALGIQDIQQVDFGEPTNIGEDEVPVFWACGVTGVKAIQSAALPQCFSLAVAPGCLFICDVTTDSFQKSFSSPYACAGLSPRVIQLCETPSMYSVLSDCAKEKLENLEALLLNDIGKRGVKNISVKDDFLKSSLRLYQSSSVAVTTGFQCFPQYPVSEETDGIPGAISIVKALCALGKDVSLIVDSRNEVLVNTVILRCVEAGILKQSVPVLAYERRPDSEREAEAVQFLYPKGIGEKPRFEHLVSIERTGPAKDGTYRNMRGVALNEDLIAPIEDIFRQALKDDRIAISSIGDGGNEMGMGKVKENVAKFVKNGECIACDVSSDYLIAAGVSNWGGHALAVALYVLSTCPIHLRYVHYGLGKPEETRKEDFLNSVEQEDEILTMLVHEGVRDGITGKLENSVDGFMFYPHHAEQITKLHEVLIS